MFSTISKAASWIKTKLISAKDALINFGNSFKTTDIKESHATNVKTKIVKDIIAKEFDNSKTAIDGNSIKKLGTDSAILNAKFLDVAYEIHGNYKSELALIPAGWEMVAGSNESPLTADRAFKGAAFINKATKQIKVITAGTSDFIDFVDDAWLATGYAPTAKLESIKNFHSLVMEKLLNQGIDPNEYKFDVTGHSLGAILATLSAADLLSRGLKVTDGLVFESPGAYRFVKQAIDNKWLTGEVTMDQVKNINFEIINAKPNFIDSMDAQIGKVFTYLPKEAAGSNQFAKLDTHFMSYFKAGMENGGIIIEALPGNPLSYAGLIAQGKHYVNQIAAGTQHGYNEEYFVLQGNKKLIEAVREAKANDATNKPSDVHVFHKEDITDLAMSFIGIDAVSAPIGCFTKALYNGQAEIDVAGEI